MNHEKRIQIVTDDDLLNPTVIYSLEKCNIVEWAIEHDLCSCDEIKHYRKVKDHLEKVRDRRMKFVNEMKFEIPVKTLTLNEKISNWAKNYCGESSDSKVFYGNEKEQTITIKSGVGNQWYFVNLTQTVYSHTRTAYFATVITYANDPSTRPFDVNKDTKYNLAFERKEGKVEQILFCKDDKVTEFNHFHVGEGCRKLLSALLKNQDDYFSLFQKN